MAAEHIGTEPVLILNKTDLIQRDADTLDTLKHYAALGYQTPTTHHQMSDASDLLSDQPQDLVLVGQSGVGNLR